MSSKRDKLKNAMSKNIFNYEPDTSTPVNDIIDALPTDFTNFNNNLDNNELNVATNPVNTAEESSATSLSPEIIEKITDTNSITPTSNVENSHHLNEEEPLVSTTNIDAHQQLEENITEPALKKEADISKNNELSTTLQETPLIKAEFLALFKNGCENINDLKDLSSIKNYFLDENKMVISISIRLDKELDVFSKIEAYKNKLTLNMYYNYIIFKDMQKNAEAQNFNPTFDLSNDMLYRKTPAYNSVQKTFSVIPELKEYLAIYGAKLGVTSGNYFKYLLRKEYQQSENSCIN